MQHKRYNILVWLPSPMGDALFCTPALHAIRRHFESDDITFLANPVVRAVLSPNNFNNRWLQQQNDNPFAIAKALKAHDFTHAILFKNSFASALAVFLARIPYRLGYTRQGRGIFLTDKLYPAKISSTKFKPVPMIDYYLAIASWLGADTGDRKIRLHLDPDDLIHLKTKLPEVAETAGPIVVLVPGGAFGPSKCWPGERFAQLADRLIADYNATVFVSVSPNSVEKQIAAGICGSSSNKLISLAEAPLSLGQLKSLFSVTDLIISNDTGPRHIAIALQRKIVTLFGPNNPAWTDTDYENEIEIVGNVPCAPCHKPICKKAQHFCMEAITVDMVCTAAQELLGNNKDKQAL
ncbi:MAG: lipopolysaccharide heptosyltransferase II [Planctomycetota bacterium]